MASIWMEIEAIKKSVQYTARGIQLAATRDEQRDAAMMEQNQNVMKEMERDREASAAMLNVAANRQEISMEKERAASKSVRDMMAADKKQAEERGDQRLKNTEEQRQIDMKLLHTQHKDSLDREGKAHEKVVKTMEDERENTRNRQQELDEEKERKNDEERNRLQSLHEDKIKVMDENQKYEREQKDKQIIDNEEKNERSREREVALLNKFIDNAEEVRIRAEERADMERERERMLNDKMLQVMSSSMNYERERSLAVQDSLFTLTAMQRSPLHGGQSTYFPQDHGQHFAQPIAGQLGNRPAQIAYKMPGPGQFEQTMQYAGNVGQPTTSYSRHQMSTPSQIKQPMQYVSEDEQPTTGYPRAQIAYQYADPVGQPTTFTGQVGRQIPIQGYVGQQMLNTGQFGQMPTTGQFGQQIPNTDQVERQMSNTGQGGQQMPNRGQFGQQMSNTGQVGQQIPNTEQVGRQMSNTEQQMPNTGQFGQQISSTGQVEQHMPNTGQLGQQMPNTGHVGQQMPTTGQVGHQPSNAGHYASLPVQQSFPNTAGLLLTADHSVLRAVNEDSATEIATGIRLIGSFSSYDQQSAPMDITHRVSKVEVEKEMTLADEAGQHVSLPGQQPFPSTGGVASLLLTEEQSLLHAVNDNNSTETATDTQRTGSVNQQSHTSAPPGDHIKIANSGIATEAGELHLPDDLGLPEAELSVQHLSVIDNM